MSKDIRQLLDKAYGGNPLSRDEAKCLFAALVRGELDEVTIAALLMALKVRGETIDEISGAADAMREAANPFPRPALDGGILDIVGTGGDGFNTINISTTATFVAAAAGAKVAKHGNRSVSSKSGSSDLLGQFGIELTMTPKTAADCLEALGICFLFAPHYHGGVKHAIPVRQKLATRTLFNVLGPLINPSHPDFMLLGVYSASLVRPIAEVLCALGVKRAMVVHGEGLDEVALHGTTQVCELKNGELVNYTLSPQDFGLEPVQVTELEGGNPEDNALITAAILKGEGKAAHRDAVALNAGCALYVAGLADTPQAGFKLAIDTLASGKAYEKLIGLAAMSQQHKA
ncbi:anthranilate phosphoribosyltransferase [Shewanella sp. FJAT-52076]|uniref:anthranilate phosphoribosyltransferase n=1 Tax=Shewanella sp. FJAT-52076 TaxID=2864202 RepID=UPI001C659AD2|nr:anthranilate phosphoribosyltransferase [Shewanella sp. FJAT-52076]QYJ73930.1 anthranilate phosphoribosyltransferase [Shewanella sp. FJAT-52076]